MVVPRRRFTREFKIRAVRELEAGKSVAEVARALEVHPSLLQRWRWEWRKGPEAAFPGLGKRRAEQNREAELERKIGQLTMENDFLKRALQGLEEQGRLQGGSGGRACTSRSKRK